ncbi:Rho termination factor N-terminal domain-containing protein [Erysipelotrichaceae bacterium OttesenSCG-928-M19]|nr:Rho termination factor N-terminal domain-containing protein [Erysipelotrichaceae bacterium OttesenSCG-928-M19]
MTKLEKMTKDELIEYASKLEIEGHSKMNKAELIELINSNTNEEVPEFRNYVVTAKKLYVRDENGEVLTVIKENDLFKGIIVDDKVVNEDGNTVVAKFVKEVK